MGDAHPAQVKALVAQLSETTRRNRLQDRRRALARLEERGLIDARQAAAVERVPLGLSPTMRDG